MIVMPEGTVLQVGLEPTILSELDFKSSAYANSATGAYTLTSFLRVT